MMQTFDEMFRTATGGYKPHGYQARIARDGLPDVVSAPTGTGKTGIILAWLWRRLSDQHQNATPRRLVYALPRRTLVEQVANQARTWLSNLGVTDDVALHVVMGGRDEGHGEWREDMHKPAIVVGTADSLVSKALNRGYGIGRAIFPIDFALVTNGAHWVIDEVQLCPESTTTLRQLAVFARTYGTAEPFGLTCMSATVPGGLPDTVDHAVGTTIEILDSERIGALAPRLAAVRGIRRLAAGPGNYQAIAAAARERHRPGHLTLVVLNTVDAAQSVYNQLRGETATCTLLHSRFRGIERAPRVADVTGNPADRIVVSTPVVEAGLDLDAAILITEAAPWPSLARRAGRCNRAGLMNGDAELWWLPPVKPAPYPQRDIDETCVEMEALEGREVTGEYLLERAVEVTEDPVTVLRRTDFIGLFDTSPDPSSADVDIAPYVRDADDLNAEVAWATWTPGENGAPDPEIKAPPAEYRCRVPLGDVAKLAKDRPVWRLDQVAGKWVRITTPGQMPARPGEVLLVNAADGGYTLETGFDLSAMGPVADSPELRTAAELAEITAGTEDTYAADTASVSQRRWQSVDEHSERTRAQAVALLRAMKPLIPNGSSLTVPVAAFLHDVGKAHEIWQDALCALAEPGDAERIASGRPWAKSGGSGALEFAGGVAFRHELASLLLIDGPLNRLLAEAPDPDLARYLVLAHHGKLRVQVRDPGDLAVRPAGKAGERKILGLEHGASSDIPAMLGQPATTLTVDLDQFELGGDRSWTRTVLALRDRYGPFVLAYLETLVRIADWRASAGSDLPG
jgi:CRISPR-associated endonuclease/helicase Cas3